MQENDPPPLHQRSDNCLYRSIYMDENKMFMLYRLEWEFSQTETYANEEMRDNIHITGTCHSRELLNSQTTTRRLHGNASDHL